VLLIQQEPSGTAEKIPNRINLNVTNKGGIVFRVFLPAIQNIYSNIFGYKKLQLSYLS